jgi:carboxymethylenebutenolidase
MTSANAQFAAHAGDPAFASAHADPLPMPYTPHGGMEVSIPCPDGKDARGYLIKTHAPGNKYLVVIHEWWGLNDHMVQMTDRLFHEVAGANVLLIDLFDGQTATTAENASKLMQSADETRLRSIVAGTLEYMGRDAVVQTIGWCFGGTWSLQAALMAGPRAAGCVIYYGQPEDDAKKLAALQCPVLGIYGDRDDWITPEKVNAFESRLKELKKTYTFKRFDAVHAFANPSNPEHHREYTAQAHAAAVEFLNRNFAGKRE